MALIQMDLEANNVGNKLLAVPSMLSEGFK